MLKNSLPETADNEYRGYAIAKWIFLIITILTIVRSLIHMFAPDGGAQSIATIPLNTFTPNGAAAVVLLMALWGSSQLLMGIFYLIVFFRYQALIPLMYVFIFLEYTMRMILMHVKPTHITGTAPGHVLDYFMMPLAIILFLLAIMRKRNY